MHALSALGTRAEGGAGRTHRQRLSARRLLVVLLLFPAPGLAECTARWVTRAPMGVARQEVGVAAIGATVYVIGGLDESGSPSAVVEAYDAGADRWTTVAALPRALHHVGAVGVGDRLYAVGGLATLAFTAVDTLYEYEPAADRWTARAPLPTARGALAVAAIDGRIYAAGGLRGGASVADFAVYDPASDAWTALPAMPTARDHLAAGAIGGIFYAVGGRDGGTLFGALEAFDPVAGGWRTDLAPMPTPRGGLAAAALGGRLFTFGGEGNPASPLGVFAETEAYEIGDRWAEFPAMPTPRHGIGAAAVGGTIHIPGGGPRQGISRTAVHEALETEGCTAPPGTTTTTTLAPGCSPATLDVLRARRRADRLRLRTRSAAPAADPAAAALVLDLLESGREILSLTLPAGSLRPRGRRLVYRSRSATQGFVRVVLATRRSGLIARLVAVLPANAEVSTDVVIRLQLAGETACGRARLR